MTNFIKAVAIFATWAISVPLFATIVIVPDWFYRSYHDELPLQTFEWLNAMVFMGYLFAFVAIGFGAIAATFFVVEWQPRDKREPG